MRALSNKAHAVLTVLRENGGEMDCNEVADVIRERTPCGACNGTGECPHDEHCERCQGRCRKCYGRGYVSFHYSDAYICLRQLLARGLASRRHPLNEWGDELRTFVYRAVTTTEAEDELERLYTAPAFGTETFTGNSQPVSE